MLIMWGKGLISSLRNDLSAFLLVLVVGIAPFLTIIYNSVQTNNIFTLAQVSIFLILIRESLQSFIWSISRPSGAFLFAFVAGACLVIVTSSILLGGYDRSIFYLSGICFFFTLVFLFKRSDDLVPVLLLIKVGSVLVVSFVFFVNLLSSSESFYEVVRQDPPIYRNIRHYNYDLMLSIGCLFVLRVSNNVGFKWFCLIFFSLAVFSLWTGGRGQLLTLMTFLGLLLFAKQYREAIVGFLLAVLGFFVVILSGESVLLTGQIDRTFRSSAVDEVSSGRLSLWYQTWNEAVQSVWFGHGADSFRNFDVEPGFVIHPHNSLLQFFVEYGVLGLLFAACFFVFTGIICLKIILSPSSENIIKTVACLVLSMYAYGLVDGIFYHAIPFSFMIVVGAMLFVMFDKARI